MSLHIRTILIPLAVVLAATPLLRSADAPSTSEAAPGPAPAQTSPKKNHPSTELEDRMDEMGNAFKKLRRQVSDPTKNASSLELVAKLRAGSEKAIKLTPAKAADLPEADRPKFIADFREGIKHLQGSIGKLEDALKANQNEEAAKILKELGAEQKEGHKKFMRPQDS